jgi:ribose transport system permease protein
MTATLNRNPVGRVTAVAHRPRGGQLAMTALERFGLPLLLVVVVIYFSLTEASTFPTVANAQSILSTQSVLAVLAIGGVVPFVAGQFDLSLPATLGLTQIVTATLMSHGHSIATAVSVALLLGAVIGLVNGLVVSRLGVNSIITTLGTASLVQGFTTYVSDGSTIATGQSATLLEFGYANWLGVPRIAYLVAGVALLVGYLLTQTPTGRSFEAVGTNPRAARLVGLPEGRLTVSAFVIAGFIAGLAGIAQVAAAGSASPTFGPNLLLPFLTAVFLGATTIRPGRYSVTGTLLAVLFLAASLSGLALAGAPSYVEPIYDGAALILAVALSTVVRRRRSGG